VIKNDVIIVQDENGDWFLDSNNSLFDLDNYGYIYTEMRHPSFDISQGIVESIDTVNNTISIGGRSIGINDCSLYLESSDGSTSTEVLLTDLDDILQEGKTIELMDATDVGYFGALGWQSGELSYDAIHWNLTSLSFRVLTPSAIMPKFSTLEGVDTINGTITIDGQEIYMPSGVTAVTWINGASSESIGLAELRNRLDTYTDTIYIVNTNGLPIAETAPGRWEFLASSIPQFRIESAVFTMKTGSLLTGVDTVNRTITIGGQTVAVPAGSYTIKWYTRGKYGIYNPVTVDIDTLAAMVGETLAAGAYAIVYSNLSALHSSSGWVFGQNTLEFQRLEGSVSINSGVLSDVNTETKTVTIGGQAIRLQGAYTIHWNSQTIDIAMLKQKLLETQAMGRYVETSANKGVYAYKVNDGLYNVDADLYFTVNYERKFKF